MILPKSRDTTYWTTYDIGVWAGDVSEFRRGKHGAHFMTMMLF